MLTLSINLSAQCDNWEGSAQKGEAEDAHTIYRQALKTKDYQMAFENWEKAYSIAPAADGKRDFHYTDGIKLYLNRWKNETDAAKKKEYIDRILKLQEEAVNCLSSGGITLKCHGQKDCYTKRIGYLQGRLAYDMFYILNTPYSKTIEQLSGAVENSGDDLILPLMGRRSSNGRDKYQYYTMTNNAGNIHTKLPISVKGRSCTSDLGCDEIFNGDVVYVEGYKDTFRATIYENMLYKYIPY